MELKRLVELGIIAGIVWIVVSGAFAILRLVG